jgi:hypothetical protein
MKKTTPPNPSWFYDSDNALDTPTKLAILRPKQREVLILDGCLRRGNTASGILNMRPGSKPRRAIVMNQNAGFHREPGLCLGAMLMLPEASGKTKQITKGGGNMKKFVCFLIFAALMCLSCAAHLGPHGAAVTIAPPLPVTVELVEPYYVYGGYHYYYHGDRWFYSRAKGGPWIDLPRHHYPKEVRFKGRDHGKDWRDDKGRSRDKDGKDDKRKRRDRD